MIRSSTMPREETITAEQGPASSPNPLEDAADRPGPSPAGRSHRCRGSESPAGRSRHRPGSRCAAWRPLARMSAFRLTATTMCAPSAWQTETGTGLTRAPSASCPRNPPPTAGTRPASHSWPASRRPDCRNSTRSHAPSPDRWQTPANGRAGSRSSRRPGFRPAAGWQPLAIFWNFFKEGPRGRARRPWKSRYPTIRILVSDRAQASSASSLPCQPAAADHGADRGAAHHVGDDSSLVQRPQHSDMGPAPGYAAAQRQPPSFGPPVQPVRHDPPVSLRPVSAADLPRQTRIGDDQRRGPGPP